MLGFDESDGCFFAGRTLIHLGRARQKSGLARLQSEQTKPEVKKSCNSLLFGPDAAMGRFVPYRPLSGESVTQKDLLWFISLSVLA